MPAQHDDPFPVRGLPHTLFRLLVFPLGWAVPFALFFGTMFGATWPTYVLAYKMAVVFSYCIGSGIWAVQRFFIPCRVIPLAEPHGRHVLDIGLYICGAAIISSYVAALIVHLTIYPQFLGSVRAVVISGMFTLLFTALFGGINFAIAFYRESVERARAAEQARAELAQAELRALRAQIQPHFLFNTLNTIAALIAENPRAAEETVTRLAEAFRYTLEASDREHVPLGRELQFVRDLLAIARVRFGERLRVEEDIEPGLEDVPVPGLLLQPLVENAVRHGLEGRPDGITVRLEARRADDRLLLTVTDTGTGFDEGRRATGNGFGLHSVRERLRALGPPHALDIRSTPGEGTRVTLTLPIEPATTPHGGSR